MTQVTAFSKNNTLNIQGNLLHLDTPKVMGIINVTPDSFYSGSRKTVYKEILQQAEKMVSEGADFLDIGGYSTRPGAEDISMKEEKERVIPAIKEVKKEFPEAIISVDTFRSEVTREAVANGANIINDVSGGTLDDKMYSTVAELKVPYILMHMRGNPQTMKQHAQYEDVTLEVIKELQQKIIELNALGVADIIIDPGFGFAKTITHNFKMLQNLQQFRILELPLLIGLSRKSLIYRSLEITPEEALNGTTALHTIALNGGAQILRVHDVREARQAIKLYQLTFSY
ncbi:MAG: dihydropteroate synthase [Candidatus Cyclobacteriaceae bacterium M2_1C_046]